MVALEVSATSVEALSGSALQCLLCMPDFHKSGPCTLKRLGYRPTPLNPEQKERFWFHPIKIVALKALPEPLRGRGFKEQHIVFPCRIEIARMCLSN